MSNRKDFNRGERCFNKFNDNKNSKTFKGNCYNCEKLEYHKFNYPKTKNDITIMGKRAHDLVCVVSKTALLTDITLMFSGLTLDLQGMCQRANSTF